MRHNLWREEAKTSILEVKDLVVVEKHHRLAIAQQLRAVEVRYRLCLLCQEKPPGVIDLSVADRLRGRGRGTVCWVCQRESCFSWNHPPPESRGPLLPPPQGELAPQSRTTSLRPGCYAGMLGLGLGLGLSLRSDISALALAVLALALALWP